MFPAFVVVLCSVPCEALHKVLLKQRVGPSHLHDLEGVRRNHMEAFLQRFLITKEYITLHHITHSDENIHMRLVT